MAKPGTAESKGLAPFWDYLYVIAPAMAGAITPLRSFTIRDTSQRLYQVGGE